MELVRSSRTRNWGSRLGLLLMGAGLLMLAWAVLVWRWEDPFTALYTTYEQHELARSYNKRVREFKAAPPPLAAASRPLASGSGLPTAQRLESEKRVIAAVARRYRLASHEGEPLGRIIVPRLGLDMLFVDGTASSSLEKGPGRDLETFMPGENRLVYVAGHRTTFLAPFSNIDKLRQGDRITLQLPYATFVYRVTHHVIVPSNDMAVLRTGDRELLALQACHPRFFATHRYIVYAVPVEVMPRQGLGRSYSPEKRQAPVSTPRP